MEIRLRLSVIITCNAREALAQIGVDKVDGIVLDLGVSSYQLDTVEREASPIKYDTPLDMRMDQRQKLTARDIRKYLFRAGAVSYYQGIMEKISLPKI